MKNLTKMEKTMTKDLIIASNNKNKVKEIKEIFTGIFDNVYSLADKHINIDIEENGSTFEENALIKARTICELTGMTTLADDSGLEVDALGGEPGIYSARYAGEGHDDAANNQKLLKAMEEVTDRKAHFTCAVALCSPNGDITTARGEVQGYILNEAVGDNGFGYDPLFFSTELGKSFAIATKEEKNAISHRGRALQKLKKLIK